MDKDLTKHIDFFKNGSGLSRRTANMLMVGGAAAASYLGGIRATTAMAAEVATKIKLTINWSSTATDDEMKVLPEIGYKHARAYVPSDKPKTVDELKALKKRFADFGVSLDSVQYMQGGKAGFDINKLLLDLPGREQAVKNIQDWIRTSVAAGMPYIGGNFMVSGVWSSARVDIRDGVISRRFDPTSDTARGGGAAGWGDWTGFPLPKGGINAIYYGRPYSYDEVMSNFKKYWVGQVLPVIEQNNAIFAFHPDDPPVFKALGGVDRITNSYANINKFFDAFGDNKHMQMMMCIGTWNEGGTQLMGAPVEQAVREMWAKRRFQEVQLRNISSPPINGMPHFDEVFQDSGYYDMYKTVKTLVDIGYDGTMHLDHTPDMKGAPFTYAAYAMGFMKACLVRALAEPPSFR